MVDTESTVSRKLGTRISAKASKLSTYENIVDYTITTWMSSVTSGILTLESCRVLWFNCAGHHSVGSWAAFGLGTRGVIVMHSTALGTGLHLFIVSLHSRVWLSCFILRFVYCKWSKVCFVLSCFCRFDKMIQVHLSISWHELLALGNGGFFSIVWNAVILE